MTGGTGDILFFSSGVKMEDKETLSNYKNLLVMLDKLE